MATVSTTIETRDCRMAATPRPIRRARARQRGQSLIVAIIVMFVLLFIGGVFVALIARNLASSGRTRDTVKALELAEAGIRMVDANLQYSPEGADWRPQPTTPITITRAGVPVSVDPDRLWLDDKDVTGKGFTRYTLPGGRVLVRVSMHPDPTNPLGKMLMIESIGRVGDVNQNDPTTVNELTFSRLRRRIVAYKQIGITDYLRYVTNRYEDTKVQADIGLPGIGVPLTFGLGGLPVRGAPTSNTGAGPMGAPMRFNCDLHLMNNVLFSMNPNRAESIMSSGKITVDPSNPNDPTQDGARLVDLTRAANSGQILPSTDPNFTTFGGLLRDASQAPDQNGYSRGITALPPPIIDTPDPNTQIPRYRQLTRESGVWIQTFNTGRNSNGAGVYVNNPRDYERLGQGQTLRQLWMNPASAAGNEYWANSPFYQPPGVYLEFGNEIVPVPSAGGGGAPTFETHPGFRLVRNTNPRYDTGHFIDEGGTQTRSEAAYTFFIYKPTGTAKPVMKLDNYNFRQYLKATLGLNDTSVDDWLPEFNGVIYAEGNVRVRGILASKFNAGIPVRGPGGMSDAEARVEVNPPSVTVVSGQTIYVEGSLVREVVTADETVPSTTIALLAVNSVAVNATMFVGPNKVTRYSGQDIDPTVPGHVAIDQAESAATPPFALDWIQGEDARAYQGQGSGQFPIRLLLRHGTPGLASYMDLFVNQPYGDPTGGNTPPNPLYIFNDPRVPTNPNAHLLAGALDQQGNAVPQFYREDFQIFPQPNIGQGQQGYLFDPAPDLATLGGHNIIRPSVDPTLPGTVPPQDYLFGRAAVVPMDVRIEAVMYAQNGSFYVIPGYPFNNDPSDTPQRAEAVASQQGLQGQAGQPAMLRPAGTSDYFPFYNDPIDCRITIVGAISENVTAPISDQAAWMQRWGYIPVRYGSAGLNPLVQNQTETDVPIDHINVDEVGGTNADARTAAEQSANITRGLRLLYDPALSAPYANYATGGAPLRSDSYGRLLPPAARMPVCPGFVFYGEQY